jgi:class 3 adenylate cyclase
LANNQFYWKWEWKFRSNQDAMWPYFADTNRFNFDRGNPALMDKALEKGERLPNGRHRLGIMIRTLEQIYEEEPFEWVRPLRHSVYRRFTSGIFDDMRLVAELEPTPDGGSLGRYHMYVHSRGLLGRLLVPYLVGNIQFKLFDKAFKKYDEVAVSADKSAELFYEGRINFALGGEDRLTLAHHTLVQQGADPELAERLVEVVRTADDLTVARLRPYALADLWDQPRRKVLELCLLATRASILEFRWELLCPLCRGAKDIANTLGSLKTQVHCNTCNIDATANFERSVELAFRPSPAIRKADTGDFCVAGPEVTPHVIAQQLLKPGDHREFDVPLAPGRYRVRAMEMLGGQYVTAAADGAPNVHFVAKGIWPDVEPIVNLMPNVALDNETQAEQLMILERMEWSEQAVTAAEVTTMQSFRDLFASEALRPGEQVSVGSMAIVFTDLRESTRMYREIGDAKAFGLVMKHFDILRESCDAYDGTVVKTIGDSIMGVFRNPASALRAMLRAQSMLSAPGVERPFYLRVGIHYGPCVGVNLNDRLDYFGSTVNIAARLEALSTGEEIVISDQVRRDPEVITLLKAMGDKIILEPISAQLKGFEQETFDLFMIAPKDRIALVV